MRDFKLILFLFGFFTLFITGCGSAQGHATEGEKKHTCAKCNMILPESNIHTAKTIVKSKEYLFDDIGCLVLWAKDKNIEMQETKITIFANDTHKYIDSSSAFFTIHEKTPMNYGFSAYEKEMPNSIKMDEVWLRMLRGEHMANPKIRKQILGQ